MVVHFCLGEFVLFHTSFQEKFIVADHVEDLIDLGTDDMLFILAVDQRHIYFVFIITITTVQVEVGSGEYWIELPMLYYKGYRAEDVVTGEVFETLQGNSGDVRVILPAGYDGSVHVWYNGMWYWRVCEVISLLTVIGIIFFWKRKRKIEGAK